MSARKHHLARFGGWCAFTIGSLIGLAILQAFGMPMRECCAMVAGQIATAACYEAFWVK